MSLDFMVSGAGGTGLFFALALLAVLVGFILWIPPRAARPRPPNAASTVAGAEPVASEAKLTASAGRNPILDLYFTIEGRTNRSIYWLAQIPLVAINVIVMMLGNLSHTGDSFGLFVLLISVVASVASIIVGIKRCHDRDKSGWWMLLSFVPMIGWLWAIIELGFLPGTAGPNRFGPDPLGA